MLPYRRINRKVGCTANEVVPLIDWKKRESPAVTDGLGFLNTAFAKVVAKHNFNLPPEDRPARVNTSVVVDFNGAIGDVGSDELSAAVAEAWQKTLEEVESLYRADEWEILVVYVTVEAGDIMTYPATLANLDDNYARFRVSLHSATWANAYDAISNPEESKKFEAAYKRLLKSIVKTLKEAVEKSDLSPRFAALKKRSGFAIYYVDGVETINREVLEFLWGNRPSKALPAESAKELFEALLRKAQCHPPDLMFFEDGVLRIVYFFGADFNDKYVELLESVPNVAHLCEGLRELHLRATRIKPPAVERLRAILPHVDVQVFAYKDDVGWYRKDI
jgi:hypothetical protein